MTYAEALHALASIGALPESLADADRADRRVASAVSTFLAKPRPYELVEEVEHHILGLWSDVLGGRNPPESEQAMACSGFFSKIGFLYKYKIYGLKMSLPFGYSVFDLKDGEGFSFQIHTEPKLEGFHILRPKSRAFIYIADRSEWNATGRHWASAHFEERNYPAPPGARRPLEGDVYAIPETSIVHTVLGCILEEYASCSVDSVERLFDQNTRLTPQLPANHPSPRQLLESGSSGLPMKHWGRTQAGWNYAVGVEEGRVIDTEQLHGWRETHTDRDTAQFSSEDSILSLVVVKGKVLVRLGASHFHKTAGDVLILPAGLLANLTFIGASTIAVHQVSAELAVYPWNR